MLHVCAASSPCRSTRCFRSCSSGRWPQGAFGRGDWFANGVLFALYHLHQPWVMHTVLLDAFILSWPSKYFRSAWIGIVVHSSQGFGAGGGDLDARPVVSAVSRGETLRSAD
jgi:hypothetical protein